MYENSQCLCLSARFIKIISLNKWNFNNPSKIHVCFVTTQHNEMLDTVDTCHLRILKCHSYCLRCFQMQSLLSLLFSLNRNKGNCFITGEWFWADNTIIISNNELSLFDQTKNIDISKLTLNKESFSNRGKTTRALNIIIFKDLSSIWKLRKEAASYTELKTLFF